MRVTELTEDSAEYVSAREELRQAEIELMRHRERVADLRRRLPRGPVVDDYAFEEGPADLHAGEHHLARSLDALELEGDRTSSASSVRLSSSGFSQG